MLNKTLPELQNLIKTADAKTAAYAAQILRAVTEKNPDPLLKQEEPRLKNHINVYNRYSKLSIGDLKNSLQDINTLPAINTLVILHLIGNLKKPSSVSWPNISSRQKTFLNYEPARDSLLNLFRRLPTRTHNPSIVDYAETTIIPSGKYRGLQFNHNRAPQLKEPLSLLSPDSPYRDVIMMTPAQFGKSTLAELTVMYYITQVPSEILYVSSNETAAVKWMERRIVPRAAAAGVHFRTEVESKTSRKTGDTTYSKMFPGGNIDIASALSPAQLASETKRIVIGDEVDRWRVELGAEGSVVDMIRARTQAWGGQSRILWISTPTTEQSSLIHQMFLSGDQRFYYVPCLHCGTMQLLDFSYGRGHGLVWEYKDGKINRHSIELICENPNCGKGIKESAKNKMLNGGEWRATAQSQYDFIASFNTNGLYSHMLSWYDMVVAYEEAQKNHIKKQAFDNLKMGKPYIDKGTRPKAEKLIENRGKYRRGEVPEGVLYITIGADVQQGSKNNPENPPRIELEVLGIGYGYRTWSIDYKIFTGDVTNPYGGAWEDLHQWAINTGLIFTRRIDGFRFPVSMVLIDSGNDPDVIYAFCGRWENTFPSKGFHSLKRRKKEAPDELTESSFKRYRPAKIGEGVLLYEVSTVYYKNQIYNNLKIERQPIEPQKPGFCDFPVDYGQEYFDQLTAEEKMSDGSFVSHGRRNEALDCRVYALCGGDAFLDSELLTFRAWAKGQGMRPDEIQKITHRSVIDNMIEATKVRKKIEKKLIFL